jgi:hypothetical protein
MQIYLGKMGLLLLGKTRRHLGTHVDIHLPSSPAGTPRRHRIARTSRTTMHLDPNNLGGGDEDDVDADFTP